jgi:hypothetical protein
MATVEIDRSFFLNVFAVDKDVQLFKIF